MTLNDPWPVINSPFLTSVVTLVVGTIAIWLYKRNQRDEKRGAARIILSELRHAEKQINRFKAGPIDVRFIDKIMLESSWIKYRHLFVENLDADDFDFITDFYSACSCIDRTLNQLSPNLQINQKANAIHRTLAQIASEASSQPDFLSKKNQVINFYASDNYLFEPSSHQDALTKLLNSTPTVTQSNAASKLKKIAIT
jgi:hypothetical protein